jgi:Family of unknown function (DUF6184)
MNKSCALAITTFTVIATIALGCQRGQERPATTTTTTAAAPLNLDVAAMRLTSARCERESACNNVGTGRKFVDLDACTRELGRDARETLRTEECPRGVNESRLSKCLSDVRGERCGNPLDAIGRLISCRRAELCVD